MKLYGPAHIVQEIETLSGARERERVLRLTAQALIERLQIQDSALLTLRLAPRPARTTREAVEAFVRVETVALAASEFERVFSVLEQRLTERIQDLFAG